MGNILFNISKLVNSCIEDCTKDDVSSMYQYYRYDDRCNSIDLVHDNRYYYSFKQNERLSPIQEISENNTSSSSISPMSPMSYNSSPRKLVDGYNSPYLTRKNTMYFIKKQLVNYIK